MAVGGDFFGVATGEQISIFHHFINNTQMDSDSFSFMFLYRILWEFSIRRNFGGPETPRAQLQRAPGHSTHRKKISSTHLDADEMQLLPAPKDILSD